MPTWFGRMPQEPRKDLLDKAQQKEKDIIFFAFDVTCFFLQYHQQLTRLNGGCSVLCDSRIVQTR